MDLDWRHVFTQILAFLILYWILKRYAWNHLYAILEARRKRIEEEFKIISKEKNEAKKLHAEYLEKLSGIDAEARAKFNLLINEAKKISEEMRLLSEKQSEALLKKAKSTIESEVNQAKAQLKNEVIHLTIAASKKVIGASLDSAKQREMIQEFVQNESF